MFAVAEARGALNSLTLEGVQSADRSAESRKAVKETIEDNLPEPSAKPPLTGAKKPRFRMSHANPSLDANVSADANSANKEMPESKEDQASAVSPLASAGHKEPDSNNDEAAVTDFRSTPKATTTRRALQVPFKRCS